MCGISSSDACACFDSESMGMYQGFSQLLWPVGLLPFFGFLKWRTRYKISSHFLELNLDKFADTWNSLTISWLCHVALLKNDFATGLFNPIQMVRIVFHRKP